MPNAGIERNTKKKILETAIELFAGDGFSVVSIRDIAGRVGIKESSIYRHFRSKDEILDTIFALFPEKFWGGEAATISVEQMLTARPPEVILTNGLRFFKERMQTPEMVMIWRILTVEQYRNAKAREVVTQTMVNRTLGFLQRLFTAMIERRIVKPLDPSLLAVEYQTPLFYLTNEYCLMRYAGQDTSEVERQMEEHAQFFWAMVKLEDSPPKDGSG